MNDGGTKPSGVDETEFEKMVDDVCVARDEGKAGIFALLVRRTAIERMLRQALRSRGIAIIKKQP